MNAPFLLCPRYDSCNVCRCPLDSFSFYRVTVYGDQGDPEKTCTLSKADRMRIAAEFSDETLPHRGMTPKEFATSDRWKNMSPDERNRMLHPLESHKFERAPQTNQKKDIVQEGGDLHRT